MDLFTFTTRSAKIDSISLIKDLEQEIRNLCRNVKQSIYDVNQNSKDEILHPFILFTKALAKFESKASRKLPDFIYAARREGAHVAIYFLTTNNIKFEYNEYLTLFSYMNNIPIKLPGIRNTISPGLQSGVQSIVYLANVIKDNPNPYIFDYFGILSSELYRIAANRSIEKAALLHGIALRQNLFNDAKYTVIEDYINHYKSKVTSADNNNLIEQSTQLLNASIEYNEMVSNGN